MEHVVGEEQFARTILLHMHSIPSPSRQQLEVAIDQVRRDPEGSRILAADEPIPADRKDLRTARSRGVYLGRKGA